MILWSWSFSAQDLFIFKEKQVEQQIKIKVSFEFLRHNKNNNVIMSLSAFDKNYISNVTKYIKKEKLCIKFKL